MRGGADSRAVEPSELDRGDADARRASVDEDIVAFLDFSKGDQVLECWSPASTRLSVDWLCMRTYL